MEAWKVWVLLVVSLSLSLVCTDAKSPPSGCDSASVLDVATRCSGGLVRILQPIAGGVNSSTDFSPIVNSIGRQLNACCNLLLSHPMHCLCSKQLPTSCVNVPDWVRLCDKQCPSS